MSEFPSIETLTAAKNAVERDRVIRETWEALVAAVEAYELADRTAMRKQAEADGLILPIVDESLELENDLNDAWAKSESQYHIMANAAMAYVKARKGNE